MALYSSVSSLLRTDQNLSNSIGDLQFQIDQLAYSNSIQIDAIYTSTIQYVDSTIQSVSSSLFRYLDSTIANVNSTLYSISTFSSFYVEIGVVQSSVNYGISSLSTSCGLQNTSTYNSLTVNYLSTINYATTSSIQYTNQQISSLSSVLAYNVNLNIFSTAITGQLLSTSAGIYSSVIYGEGQITSTISTIFNSTVIPLVSTSVGNTNNIYALNALSTQMSSITYGWISSFVSTSQALQDVYTFTYINTVSTGLGTLYQSTNTLINHVSTFSTNQSTINGILISTNTNNTSSLISLQYQLNVLTTSSILAGVYDSFIQLEAYTSTLIGSTINTVGYFTSSLFYSTSVQNTSISKDYYNYFVSSLYTSTLSTLIPSTFALTSSLISSLYSTGSYFLVSSLGSTTVALTNQFYSTTSSLTSIIVFSTQAQVNSSILGYVSTPMGENLSTFSTLQFQAISSFNVSGASTLTYQSTVFGQGQSSFNILYASSLTLFGLQSIVYISSIGQISSISSLNSIQQSTQSGLFNSTLNTYPQILTTSVNSTNTAIAATTTAAATVTLTSIENSTLVAYNTYVGNLNAQISTVGFSSLYAFQNLSLTGSNYTATMDMINYRNFTIRVFGINNGLSNYRINYLSNGIGGLDYRKGIITIDISTVGSAYSNNNGQARFDVYRWGIPTTVFGNIYPTIANADYTLQYEYTILNQVIYTNLLNVYPRLAARNTQIIPITQNVRVGSSGTTYNNTLSSSVFWRGTPITVRWTNYSYFPFGSLGSPPFNPDILVDIVVGGTTVAQYGPFPLSISSVTIVAPNLSNQTSNLVNTTVLTYIAGNIAGASSANFTTAIPQFTQVQLFTSNYPAAAPTYIGGTELVGITDAGLYPMLNAQTTTSPFSNDPLYSPANMVRGTLNTLGVTGLSNTTIVPGNSAIVGQFTEGTSGYAEFNINLSNYFTYILPIQSFGSQFTFTLSNALSSFSFLATSITPISGTQFRIANTLFPKSGIIFSNANPVTLRYSYTQPTSVVANSAYVPSTFLGPPFLSPTTTGPPQSAFVTYTYSPPSIDHLNKLFYYNVTCNSAIGSFPFVSQTSTAGSIIAASFNVGGTFYTSTLFTTGNARDVFQF